jgi:hypothetical protein
LCGKGTRGKGSFSKNMLIAEVLALLVAYRTSADLFQTPCSSSECYRKSMTTETLRSRKKWRRRWMTKTTRRDKRTGRKRKKPNWFFIISVVLGLFIYWLYLIITSTAQISQCRKTKFA